LTQPATAATCSGPCRRAILDFESLLRLHRAGDPHNAIRRLVGSQPDGARASTFGPKPYRRS
jgi:hypothetical protein